jgi:hypothetical protein
MLKTEEWNLKSIRSNCRYNAIRNLTNYAGDLRGLKPPKEGL